MIDIGPKLLKPFWHAFKHSQGNAHEHRHASFICVIWKYFLLKSEYIQCKNKGNEEETKKMGNKTRSRIRWMSAGQRLKNKCRFICLLMHKWNKFYRTKSNVLISVITMNQRAMKYAELGLRSAVCLTPIPHAFEARVSVNINWRKIESSYFWK